MDIPLELLGAISLAGERVTEEFLGPFLTGRWMKLAAILACVGLAYGAWVVDLNGLAASSALQVLVLGVFAGLGSNLLHSFLVLWAPDSKKAPLAGVLKPEEPPK